MKIHWPDTISNADLWSQTEIKPIELVVKQRKWRWIGHTLRKPNTNIAKEALEWNPQGKRKRGRPTTTWRRSVMAEARQLNKTWSELKEESKNRVRWRQVVAALCSERNGIG